MGLSTKACTLPVQEASINKDSSGTAGLDITWCHNSAWDPKNLPFLRAQCSSSPMDGAAHFLSINHRNCPNVSTSEKLFYPWNWTELIIQNCQQFILQASVHKERLKTKDVALTFHFYWKKCSGYCGSYAPVTNRKECFQQLSLKHLYILNFNWEVFWNL